jgi:hypothetical protein
LGENKGRSKNFWSSDLVFAFVLASSPVKAHLQQAVVCITSFEKSC